jgi:hypothetical protein
LLRSCESVEFITNRKPNNRENLFDKPPQIRFNTSVKMNTTFTKQMKTQVPVNGCVAIWQRKSRRFGVVGMKF